MDNNTQDKEPQDNEFIILVLGNGFDLAHGLKTKYTDFLDWVKLEYDLYNTLLKSQDKFVNSDSHLDDSSIPNNDFYFKRDYYRMNQ